MGQTQIGGSLVKDGSIGRDDLDASTAGKAVIRKVIAGTNVTISSTGSDAGTGDVTINAAVTGGGLSAFQTQMLRGAVRRATWIPPGNATTLPGVNGMAALTAVGTVTARNVANFSAANRYPRLGYVSAATAGALAGHFSPVAQYCIGSQTGGSDGFFYQCIFGASDAAAVTGVRRFVGLTSGIVTPTNVEPSSLTNCIGLAKLSGTSNNVAIVYGGSAAQTPINLPAFPDSSGFYLLTLLSPGDQLSETVTYEVLQIGTTNVVSGTITATTSGVQLPSPNTFLAHRAWTCNNATALATGIDIAGVLIQPYARSALLL